MKHPEASKRINEVFLHLGKDKLAFTQKEFIEKVGIHRQTVHDLFTGNLRLTEKLANKIVEAYPEFSYTYLVNGTGSLLASDAQQANQEDLSADPLDITVRLLSNVIEMRKELAEIKQMLKNQTK